MPEPERARLGLAAEPVLVQVKGKDQWLDLHRTSVSDGTVEDGSPPVRRDRLTRSLVGCVEPPP